MKTNFNSNLFDKKIDLNSCDTFGGRAATGCSHWEATNENGGGDERTRYYDEDGNLTRITYCYE